MPAPTTWLRLYTEALDDLKVQRLPGETFKGWVNLLMLAKLSSPDDGFIPPIEVVAYRLRMAEEAAALLLDTLADAGLVERTETGFKVHGWNRRQYPSDSSAERMRKHRAKKAATLGDVTRDVTGDGHVTSVTSQVTGQSREEESREEQPRAGARGPAADLHGDDEEPAPSPVAEGVSEKPSAPAADDLRGPDLFARLSRARGLDTSISDDVSPIEALLDAGWPLDTILMVVGKKARTPSGRAAATWAWFAAAVTDRGKRQPPRPIAAPGAPPARRQWLHETDPRWPRATMGYQVRLGRRVTPPRDERGGWTFNESDLAGGAP